MKKMRYVFLFLALTATECCAYTDCVQTIKDIWAGDEGYIWFHFHSGGSFKLPPSDPDQKAILSLGMVALATGKKIMARYHEDNVDCASVRRDDVRGIYLYASN